ncbi:MAG: hypothetical protein SAK29_26505, partial [Scytonema sp. PMC 1069.18]|nr:hypothetical protein [Scytonema sp. PMC 1069.18]
REQIETLFGTQAVEYIQRKNTGGISSSKGIQYEDIFAVYQLALLSRCVIECKKEIYILSQCFVFVDDLVIDNKSETFLRHYQLKNSLNVNWGEGDRSIGDDFKKQYFLNKSLERESEISLVVSSEELKERLQTNMPNSIKSYSRVLYFCFEKTLPTIIDKEKNFRLSLEYLCAFEHPEPDKLECLASVLLGAWASSDKSNVSIMDILKKAQDFIPSYIRSFQAEWQIDAEVENILSTIDGFTYNLTRGFLHWEFQNGLDEGTLSYSIETERFKRFQELIKKNCPTSFEELEVFLI